MRLIDADALKKDLTRFYDNEVTAKRLIDEQLTIEPQPQHEVQVNDEDHVWIDGKQYISLRRFMEAVKDARRDVYKRGKSKGIKKGRAMVQRMKGRWIHDGCDIPHGVDWMHCSVCGRREPYVPAAMTNYCPTCGTEMETEQQ